MYKVFFTDAILKELQARGVSHPAALQDLGRTVAQIKRRDGLDVDTSDNSVTIAGLPVSFIRDHKKKEIIILTNGEAINLDLTTGSAKLYFAGEFLDALGGIEK